MNELIEQARSSVMAQIKDEAEAARELGRQQGLREGHQTGMQEAKAEFRVQFAQVKSLSENLQNALETNIKGVEDLAIAIVFESVCQILGSSAMSLDGVQGMVREVARRVSVKEKLTIRINPLDFDTLQQGGALDRILPSQTSDAVTWMPDSNIALGGVILETAVGDFDARLDTQVENLRTTLLNARRSLASQ
ncbi:FliH/SctL family protein [Undibacterium sp. Di26W]|uniref:FliH/SctL family protein n=1 Tax=Undibacterium sp. Di26W TaxID=3413035 RepID=UPI003BF00960